MKGMCTYIRTLDHPSEGNQQSFSSPTEISKALVIFSNQCSQKWMKTWWHYIACGALFVQRRKSRSNWVCEFFLTLTQEKRNKFEDFSSFTGYAKKIHTIKLKRENFEQTWLSRATFLIRKLLLIRKLTYLSRIASIWTFLPTVVSLFFFTTVIDLTEYYYNLLCLWFWLHVFASVINISKPWPFLSYFFKILRIS